MYISIIRDANAIRQFIVRWLGSSQSSNVSALRCLLFHTPFSRNTLALKPVHYSTSAISHFLWEYSEYSHHLSPSL